jgi:predicted HTH domain antitoxin
MKRKISKFETWLYDNVFNNEKLGVVFSYDLFNIYNNIKRKIRTIKSWSIFFKFWKIPTYIDSFNSAVEFAELEIKELRDQIEDRDIQIELCIDILVEQLTDKQLSEIDATREAYELIYPDTWKDRIDYKYLTDREAHKRFDRDYENHRDAISPYNDSYHDLMDYEISQLKKGGIYEASY